MILLINPNSHAATTREMADLARAEVARIAPGAGIEVVGRSNSGAPPLLTTPQDMVDAEAGVIRMGREAVRDPAVRAVIVSAFSDPGLGALRDALSIPVFGIGEQAFHAAALGGRRFAVVTTTPAPALVASFQKKADALGYGAIYQGTFLTEGEPKALMADPSRLDAALIRAVHEAVRKSGAQAVIMGGGPLSAPALRVQPEVSVPLVVAVHAAARAAAAAVAGGA